MPHMRDSSLENKTNRLKLAARRLPYTGPTLARGVALLYRRNNHGAGTWVVRALVGLVGPRVPNEAAQNGKGKNKPSPYWTKAFAQADDYDDKNGVDVLDFFQAQDRAKQLVRGGGGGGGDDDGGKPVTVDEALKDYARDLKSRGARPVNAHTVRHHLPTALAAKPVALLTSRELRAWRDGVAAAKTRDGNPLAPATVNRVRNGLRAALLLAAKHDPRIKNRDAIKHGLEGLPTGNSARLMVLADDKVRCIVAEAYRINQPFGLLVEVLAETGARISQVVRVNCDDLLTGDRLAIPPSKKGRGKKKVQRIPVPITAALAAALAVARGNRDDNEPLLRNPDGERWQPTTKEPRGPFRIAVERAGLDPDQITSYALRHSSICRSINAGVPLQLVASLHDTSVSQIENHYGKYNNTTALADTLARRGLLQSSADNVVSLPRVA